MNDKIIDVLIIGGGPAGATAGLLLAQAGWSVQIVEQKTFPRRKVCGEFISATSLALMQQLGIADYYLSTSGPEIRRVGFYAADLLLATEMPSHYPSQSQWGRALGRENLDTVLLEKARKAGAIIRQPAVAQSLEQYQSTSSCSISLGNGQIEKIHTRMVIVANGSWDHQLSQTNTSTHKASDLLAFKAHFKNSELAPDLMPLIVFPGGYGGLVHTDNERTSLSCCIRRDVLRDVRAQNPGISAGEAVLLYIKSHCLGVSKVLAHAERDGKWLSCGPIRPGIRKRFNKGIFYVGNIAGEAHPIVAEGISMAMQSAWLLTQILIKHQTNLCINRDIHRAGKEYSKQWRKHFATRIYAASLFSQFAKRPFLLRLMIYSIKCFPGLLTFGAKLSGKIRQVVPEKKPYFFKRN